MSERVSDQIALFLSFPFQGHVLQQQRVQRKADPLVAAGQGGGPLPPGRIQDEGRAEPAQGARDCRGPPRQQRAGGG